MGARVMTIDPLAAMYPSAAPEAAEAAGEHSPAAATPQSVQDAAPDDGEAYRDFDLAQMYDAAADASSIGEIMRLPVDPEAAGFSVAPEAAAERSEVREVLSAIGVSRTEVESIWQAALASAAPAYKPMTQEAATATLRAEWGTSYARNIASAHAAVALAAQRSPAIMKHLEATGLGNDPAFIRKMAHAGKRRGL